jgi:hypothetical protein
MMANQVTFKRVFFALGVIFTLFSFKGDEDPLNKRVFNISLGESKDGVPGKKNIADKFTFKNGMMYSDYLDKKFGYKWIRYRINKDSTFVDSTNTDVRLLVVEATDTDDNNQTVLVEFEQLEWDIDGVVKITKNDKIKRYFDFVGREKGGKPKKVKKKKEGEKKVELIKAGEKADKVYEETIKAPPAGGN